MSKIEDDFSFYDLFLPLTTKKVFFLIIIIGFIVFANMLFNAFVWDDKFIQYSPEIRHFDLLNLLGANIFNNVNAGHYRFTAALYSVLVYSIIKDSAFYYHLLQLLFHLSNTFFVFLIFKKFIRFEIAFFASLIFLIHPIQVESVSYIASTDSVLFFILGISALFLSMKDKLSIKKIFLLFFLALLGLMTKETGIFFIILIILYRFIFSEKIKMPHVVGGISAITIYFYIRFFYAGVFVSKMTLAHIARVTPIERFITIPSVILYYLKTFLFPINQSVGQQWVITNISFVNFILPLTIDILFLLGLLFFGKYLFKKNKKLFKPYLFFSLWFIMGISIYSQIIPLDMTVSDRWFYFPFVGLLGICGIFVETQISKKYTKILLGFTFLVLSLLSVRTIIRNSNWLDPITLYSHDSKIADTFDIENSLGGELNFVGRSQEAFIHFKKSVALFPHETNLFNLGLSYERQNDMINAEKYYFAAFNSKYYGEVASPHRHQQVTYERLGILLLRRNSDEAINVINKGLTDYPTDATLWYIKSIYFYRSNKQSEALASAKKALEILPNSPQAQYLYNQLKNNLPLEIKL